VQREGTHWRDVHTDGLAACVAVGGNGWGEWRREGEREEKRRKESDLGNSVGSQQAGRHRVAQPRASPSSIVFVRTGRKAGAVGRKSTGGEDEEKATTTLLGLSMLSDLYSSTSGVASASPIAVEGSDEKGEYDGRKGS
jgi:hypothetical protein